MLLDATPEKLRATGTDGNCQLPTWDAQRLAQCAGCETVRSGCAGMYREDDAWTLRATNGKSFCCLRKSSSAVNVSVVSSRMLVAAKAKPGRAGRNHKYQMIFVP